MKDLHRIPDDLSIPEFLKRDRRRIRSDYELDDVASRVLIRTLQAAIDKNERRKIVGLLKARAWDLAARKVRPGRA